MEQCTVHRFFSLPANGLEEPATQELQDRLALAFADHQVRGMAQKTAFRITELARKAALDSCMVQAIESSDPAAGNVGILAALENAFAEVSTELNEWNNAARISQQRASQRAADTNRLVVRAMDVAARKRCDIAYIERQQFSARVRTSDKAERLRKAGLTEAELDILGVLPPEVDTEKLGRQWQILSTEIAAIERFCTDPLRRVALLGEIDLYASDDADRQRVEKLAEADAKDVIAANVKRKTRKQKEAERLTAQKAEKDAKIVERAVRLRDIKQRTLDSVEANIMAAQNRHFTDPELSNWRQQAESIGKDIAALNEFCRDYPAYRIELANGLLDVAP